MPLDLIMGSPLNSDHASTVNEFVSEMRVRAEKCYDIAREHLRVSAERRKKTYDLKVSRAEFNVGEWVWYYYPRRYHRKSPKMAEDVHWSLFDCQSHRTVECTSEIS